ncbi:RAMP superfamily CRISPR-associated protein [Streptomyces canus]|uniref:RAMP superfamily CRISPR-associated protein n=1 Tax=Streptomyces canus TaxID=58343 RepID=UPI003864E9D5|nr:RAMP superfamily CRISPR-associated protein [Streptomyces canus]
MTEAGPRDGAQEASRPVALTVTVRMLGDWHVGSGAGRHGFLDRGIQRDDDGLPFVPAKTLVGVWRDACETAAGALDGGGTEASGWRRWVEFLFGSQPALQERGVVPDAGAVRPPRPAALHVDSLHYPSAMAATLRSRPLLRTAAAFVKPGVVIDPVTGRAEDELLRMEEMARGGIALSGRAELALDGVGLTGEQVACAAGLLDAGARLVEALGGRRRRGAGRCRLEVSGLPYDWQWLQGRSAPAVPETATEPTPTALPEAYGRRRAAAEEAWEAAELRLVLRRALVAHERTVGNTVRSAGRVPGRALLPAVLERLGSAEAAMAARAGRLVVTDATVEVDGQAGRAEPLALAQAKDEQGRLFNGLQEQPGDGVGAEPVDGSSYVGPYRSGEPLQRTACAFTQHTHNTIDDTLQRPVEEVGGLYTYQAIATGTVLRAQVRLPVGLVPPGWQERLSGTWRLGQSRKDGYGLCEVTATAADCGRTRSARTGPQTGPGGRLRVWLLSDTLVVDERLRPSSRAADLARVLGDALGVVLAEVPQHAPAAAAAGGTAGAGVRFSEVRRSDPWHARWGLPRASLLGLRAGSCLTLEVVSGTLAPQAVARVECEGVGLRRAEGFGQLLIDDPLLYASLADVAPARAPAECGASGSVTAAAGGGDGEVLPDEAASAVAVLEEAAWREAVRRQGPVVAQAGRDGVLGVGHGLVRSSQLAGLLPLVSRLGGPADEAARAWLERLRQVPGERRRRPWPDAVVEAVTALLREPGRVWDLLGLPEEDMGTGTARAGALRERLWPVAVRTLVEDCLTALRRDETARRTETASRRA